MLDRLLDALASLPLVPTYLLLMALSAVLPFVFFRRKGWL